MEYWVDYMPSTLEATCSYINIKLGCHIENSGEHRELENKPGKTGLTTCTMTGRI